MGVWPGHGLQCGGIGGVEDGRRLVEDVEWGLGFSRRWLLGIRGRGPGLSPARAGVEEVDDTLTCGRPAALLLGLLHGPCVVALACALATGEMLCVRGEQLYVDHLPTILISPEFDGSPHLLVVGSDWLRLDVDL